MNKIIIIIALMFGACSAGGSGKIHFIIPENFHGIFVIKPDGNEKPSILDEKLVYKIPSSGILHVKDTQALRKWHATTAEWSNGQKLPVAISNENTFSLRYLSSDDEGNIWFLVGDFADEDRFHKSHQRVPGNFKQQ